MIGGAVLLRHLRAGGLLRDLVMLTLVGGLAAFAVLFAAKPTFDRVVFEASLDYGWRTTLAPVRTTSGVGVESVPEISASRLTDTPTGGSRLSDYEHSVLLPAMVFAPESAARTARVFHRVLADGEFSPQGIEIDQATAHQLRIGVGDDVALVVSTDAGLVEMRYRVAGLLLPYQPPGEAVAGGLVIVPADLFEPLRAAGAQPAGQVWFSDAEGPGAVSHQSMISAVLFDFPQTTTFVAIILALGVALWALAIARASSDVVHTVGPCARTLLAIGTGPAVIRATLVGTLLLLSTSAALGAVGAAGALITSWANYYIQWREQGAVALILVATSALIIARFTRNPGRLDSRRSS